MEYIKAAIVPKLSDVLLMLLLGFVSVISVILSTLYAQIHESARQPLENFVGRNFEAALDAIDSLPLTGYFSLTLVWALIGVVAFSVAMYVLRSGGELKQALFMLVRYTKPRQYSAMKYFGTMALHAAYHVLIFLLLLYYLKLTVDGAAYASTIISAVVQDSQNTTLAVLLYTAYYSTAVGAWYYLGAILLRFATLKKRILFNS